MSQKILKSGAAVGIASSFAATSWLTVSPVGLAYVGTTHMPLMDASSLTSAAILSASGPSAFIGTVTISMPKEFSSEKWRS